MNENVQQLNFVENIRESFDIYLTGKMNRIQT